ncbi:GNAT family N-acetyltransferase [Halobellus ruber]|uniref:GNAT family N-acetyltransferase n=1 Tax=Halobellus ruber TaxID=2761102 RepID=A0A7J9SL76_9EURY|nr:GNAT family N-acetyltransferase [Halobellus ruber]
MPRVIEAVREVVERLLARVRPTRITLVHPPVTFVDDAEREITVRPYEPDDFEGLVRMYETFDPTQRAQGTPPLDAEAIRGWLTGLLDGVNAVAVHEGRPVGHISFVPDGTGRHELAIFVHQEFQHAGIGTTLMAAGLGHASRTEVTYVWLSVESWKRDIQRFYARAGFSVVNPMGAAHRMSRTL